jgi:predicted RNA-binding Zn-ribbon protein involved in translation (DUF1610 family)
MNRSPLKMRLDCPRCSWRRVLDEQQVVERLRQIKMLRRAANPDPDLVLELFTAAAARFPCPHCDTTGLRAQEASGQEDDWDDPGRSCEACGQPIPRERIELFPVATRCAACQRRSDLGGADEVAEYCPRCGSVMVTRPASGSGITRYELSCPQCRR